MCSFVRAGATLGCLLSFWAIGAAVPAHDPPASTPPPGSLNPVVSAVPATPGPLSPAVRQAQTTCATCHVVPDPGLVTRDAWEELARHYLETAPVDRVPHEPRPTITVGLKQFSLENPDTAANLP
jgi:hypothetical protein